MLIEILLLFILLALHLKFVLHYCKLKKLYVREVRKNISLQQHYRRLENQYARQFESFINAQTE